MPKSTDLDPFSHTRGDDDAIMSLFRRWRDELHVAEMPVDEVEANALAAVVWNTEHEIAATPASGAAGLSIKAYVMAYRSEECGQGDSGALGAFTADAYGVGGRLCLKPALLRGLVADAVRFVPELAPLAAGMIEAPRCGDGDAALIGAEREVRDEFQRRAALREAGADEDEISETTSRPIVELIRIINGTPPMTIAGCAAKLRFLTDEENIEIGDDPDDHTSLGQILTFLEAIEVRS
jgi:hypothetical protein